MRLIVEDDNRWRGREGTLEGIARGPIAEMERHVGEEDAPEELRQVAVPAHDCLRFGVPFSPTFSR